MKPAYYEKNHEGFEADIHLRRKVKSLIDKYDVRWAIESGSYRGATSLALSRWVKSVSTIEINQENYNFSKNLFEQDGANIDIHLGSSEKLIGEIIFDAHIRSEGKPILFYLDAHWQEYNPLLDELEVIANSKLKPILIIHDFKVPGHPELGFDSYGGQDYEWEWIKESVEKIYGVDGYNIEYNSEAAGARRGVIFLTPKA